MRSPASSFRAERASGPWYREPWPWLLMAGPFIVVVACIATAWLAFKSNDGLVAADYYRQGLMVNRKVPRAEADPAYGVGATIAVTAGGEVRARIEGRGDVPRDVRLKLSRPGATESEVVLLRPVADGDYIGTLSAPPTGRWLVTLESRTWRLPTTVADRLSDVRLGIAERRRTDAE